MADGSKASAGHVASLRWQQGGDRPRLLQSSALPLQCIGRPQSPPTTQAVTTLAQPGIPTAAPSLPFQRLLPETDLNLPPRNWLAPGSLDGPEDWSHTDLYRSLRPEFASSTLAAMGGESDVHFIAPAEHMKRLFTLPYCTGRVAFPVHRVGDVLVVDGDVAEGEGKDTAALNQMEASVVDALGQIELSSSSASGGVEQPNKLLPDATARGIRQAGGRSGGGGSGGTPGSQLARTESGPGAEASVALEAAGASRAAAAPSAQATSALEQAASPSPEPPSPLARPKKKNRHKAQSRARSIPHPNPNPDPGPDPDPNSDPNPKPNPDPDPKPYPDPKPNPDPNPNLDPNPDPNLNPIPEPNPKP